MADQNVQSSISVPFGAGAAPVDVTMQDPPGGPHEVEITNFEVKTSEKSGKTSGRVTCTIISENGKGISTQVFFGTDYSKAFNVGHCANLVLGLHSPDGKFIPADKLKGNFELTREKLVGKRAYIFVREAMEGEIDDETGKPPRANKNFLAKAQYEAAVRAAAVAASSGAPAPKATPKPKAAAAPTPETSNANGATPPAAEQAAGGDLDGMFA